MPRPRFRPSALPIVALALALGCGGDGGSPAPDDTGGAAETGPDAAPDSGAGDAQDDGATDGVAAPAPVVEQVLPPSGPVEGLQSVAVLGRNFVGACTVRFGEQAAAGVTVVNDRALDLRSPRAEAPGPVDVAVTCDGGTGIGEAAYTYEAEILPQVSGFAPLFGDAAGGDEVVFTGIHLEGGERTLVRFGGGFATNVTVVDDTTIRCTTPNTAPGVVSVSVEIGDVRLDLDDPYTFVRPLTVTAIEPPSGDRAGGSPVTLVGTDLVESAVIAVTFGDASADSAEFLYSEDGTTLDLVAPTHDTVGLVDVTVTALLADVVLEDAFAFVDPVTVTALDPSAVPSAGGDRVRIEGADFDADADPLDVLVGETEAFDVTFESATEVSFLTPALAAGRYEVALRHGLEVATVPGLLDVFDPIEVITVSPDTGPASGGTRVQITGSGFVEGVIVRFGTALGTDVTVDAGGAGLAATTPVAPGGPGVVDVVVQSPFTSDRAVGAFTYGAD